MIFRYIVQVLKQIVHLQTELMHKLSQMIDSHQPVQVDEVWLHTEDVMKLFKKSEKTIYNWRRSGALRCKIVGRTVFYLKSDIYRILSKE